MSKACKLILMVAMAASEQKQYLMIPDGIEILKQYEYLAHCIRLHIHVSTVQIVLRPLEGAIGTA